MNIQEARERGSKMSDQRSRSQCLKALKRFYGQDARFQDTDEGGLRVLASVRGRIVPIVEVNAETEDGRAGLPFAAVLAVFRTVGFRLESGKRGLEVVAMSQAERLTHAVGLLCRECVKAGEELRVDLDCVVCGLEGCRRSAVALNKNSSAEERAAVFLAPVSGEYWHDEERQGDTAATLVVECGPCSEAGGADRAVHHAAPACKPSPVHRRKDAQWAACGASYPGLRLSSAPDDVTCPNPGCAS